MKQVPIKFYPKNFSYSAVERYETCPFAYKRTDILRDIKNVPGPEAAWGNMVHQLYEDAIKEGRYVEGEHSWLNRYLAPFYEFTNSRRGVIVAEGETVFTKQFKLTEKFAKGENAAWWRTYSDVLVFLNSGKIILYADWKTGAMKPRQINKYKKQLRYAALALFIRYPHCEAVYCADVWVKDGGKVTAETFHRSEMNALLEEMLTDAAEMAYSIQHDNFPKKPGGLCKGWCAVTDCPHWTPKPEKTQ